MKRILLVTFLMVFASLSHAEVYKWVDEKGGVHFTDDYDQVPQKYRNVIEKQEGLFSGGKDDKKETASSEKKEAIRTDRLGRGEDYWKGRVEEWNKKLKLAQQRIETLRGKYNELTEKFNQSKSSVERSNLRMERDQIKKEIDDHRAQIEEAKVMLEKKIPEEAELFKAKPEWVKP